MPSESFNAHFERNWKPAADDSDGRNYDAEAAAKAVTELFRSHGARNFRCEYDRNGVFWIQPAANGAILATGRSPLEAAESFAKAGATMLRAAKGEPAKPTLAGVDWSGGRVFIYPESGGYGVEHEPENGGRFEVHWSKTRKGAIAAGEERAERFGAKLFIQFQK